MKKENKQEKNLTKKKRMTQINQGLKHEKRKAGTRFENNKNGFHVMGPYAEKYSHMLGIYIHTHKHT